MEQVVVISVVMTLMAVMAVTSSPGQAALRTVIADNQTAGQDVLVMEGDSVRLSCHTDMQWFFCLWNSPQLGTDNKTKKTI